MFDAPAIIERVRFRPGWVLGELVVIILGVLIALGADRWNQDRLDQIAEREYLEALAADLQTDTASQAREIVRVRETFDDLTETGRLRLIRNPALRRQLTDYYQFIERRSQSYGLQGQRVWGDYMPISQTAVPLELQEWAYGRVGRIETDAAPPTAADALIEAIEVELGRDGHRATGP